MRLVILDETIGKTELSKGAEDGSARGEVMGWICDKASFLKIHMPDCESLMLMKKRSRNTEASIIFPNRCLTDIEPFFNAANLSVVIKSKLWSRRC